MNRLFVFVLFLAVLLIVMRTQTEGFFDAWDTANDSLIIILSVILLIAGGSFLFVTIKLTQEINSLDRMLNNVNNTINRNFKKNKI